MAQKQYKTAWHYRLYKVIQRIGLGLLGLTLFFRIYSIFTDRNKLSYNLRKDENVKLANEKLEAIAKVSPYDADVAARTQAFVDYIRSSIYKKEGNYKWGNDKEILNDFFINVPGLKDQFTSYLNGNNPDFYKGNYFIENDYKQFLLNNTTTGNLVPILPDETLKNLSISDYPQNLGISDKISFFLNDILFYNGSWFYTIVALVLNIVIFGLYRAFVYIKYNE